MNKSKKGLTGLERYLLEEIGVEFKACIYFFCFLFFYSIYKLIGGSTNANIIHMAEMILSIYGMCYVQIYLMKEFDEGEHFKLRELLLSIVCSGIYTLVSWFGEWFNKNVAVTIGFFLYVILCYICGFLVYKIRRELDAKSLNEDLRAFKKRGENHE